MMAEDELFGTHWRGGKNTNERNIQAKELIGSGTLYY